MKSILLALCFLAVASAYVDYAGDQVFRVKANDADQLQQLNSLSSEYDLWHEARRVGSHADVHIPKDQIASFSQRLKDEGYEFSVMIADVGELINQQRRTTRPEDKSRLDYYRTLSEVEEFIDDMAAEFPDLVTVSQIATSYEGRPITMLKISTGGSKPAFWMDTGIHSREWVAPASNIYFIDQLLRGYGSDAEITELIDGLDFYIVPVFNVDGYEYTFTDDRLWRKTRSPNENSACVGTDPNRNWDVQWGVVGAGGPCTQTFPGDSAFSEVEVREVAAYMAGIERLMGVMAIHSYGQMYMLPYGYTSVPNPDFDEQMEICNEAESALNAIHGQTYRCDSLINLVGPNSGSSVDYTYDVLGIKLSFGVEMRDTGAYGFLLPENQIVPTGEENFEAVKVIARAALEEAKKQ